MFLLRNSFLHFNLFSISCFYFLDCVCGVSPLVLLSSPSLCSCCSGFSFTPLFVYLSVVHVFCFLFDLFLLALHPAASAVSSPPLIFSLSFFTGWAIVLFFYCFNVCSILCHMLVWTLLYISINKVWLIDWSSCDRLLFTLIFIDIWAWRVWNMTAAALPARG